MFLEVNVLNCVQTLSFVTKINNINYGPNLGISIFQSAVKAASEGRVLVLEGIEKAERNVLPVLNNLLENREMHLEDGRLLIPASR